jgi:hypothetical protein
MIRRRLAEALRALAGRIEPAELKLPALVPELKLTESAASRLLRADLARVNAIVERGMLGGCQVFELDALPPRRGGSLRSVPAGILAAEELERISEPPTHE